jgi:hypothetical protein
MGVECLSGNRPRTAGQRKEKAMSQWCPTDAELKNLTIEKARDMVVNCFFEAQKETLARAKERLGRIPDDATLHRDVENIVRLTFKEQGFSFDSPTQETLGAVVMQLAQKAGAWGTPKDIIEHHRVLIGKIFSHLA